MTEDLGVAEIDIATFFKCLKLLILSSKCC